MKKLVLLTLTVASIAHAQNPATPAAVVEAKPPVSAAGAVSVQETQVAPTEARKWGALLISESFMGVDDAERLGGTAPTHTVSQVGMNYKVSPTWTVEGRQTFSSATNRENFAPSSSASNPAQIHRTQGLVALDPMIIAKLKTATGVLGSNPLSHAFRYEIPVGQASRELKRNGYLRYDTNLAWNTTPKLETSFGISPRVYLNSSENPNAAVGSNAVYRWVGGPALTYAFTDKVNAYAAYTVDARSSTADHGTLRFDQLNLASHEIGMNLSTTLGQGNITLNPALSSDVTLDDGTSSIATTDSRVFSHENNTYYLALTATY
ncbi:MAG: hypothetical protein V4736_11085 [Bdellovibrionota bacterium]